MMKTITEVEGLNLIWEQLETSKSSFGTLKEEHFSIGTHVNGVIRIFIKSYSTLNTNII